MNFKPNPQTSNLLADRFYAGLEYLSALMRKVGMSVEAYPEDLDRTFFSRYEEERQLKVLTSLENYINICENALGKGPRYVGTQAFTWSVLKYMNFTVQEDVLRHEFQTGDIVEIYGLDNKMLFASVEFLMTVTYSLMDLYCGSWEELYYRDPEIARQLAAESQKILTGEVNETLYLNIPEHQTSETRSKSKKSVWLRPILFSPIYRDGQLAGFLDIIRIRPYP